MDESYPNPLHIWEDWAGTVVSDESSSELDRSLLLPFQLPAVAEHLYARESLQSNAAPLRRIEGAEPYSLQWFLNIENQRHSRHGRWIPRLLEFSKHAGDTLLGLGEGLGTDWVQYARHGAAVVVCSPWQEQLSLIRRNFELRGLSGRFLPSRPMSLPLENCSIDVVCASSMPGTPEEFEAVTREIYRVLKPGGKVLAVTQAKYDVSFWSRTLFPIQHWFQRKRIAAEEPTLQFSTRRLKRQFDRFNEHRVYKRQLRRSHVPYLWRGLPLPLLERLMGRLLIIKAFKPLSSAISMLEAA